MTPEEAMRALNRVCKWRTVLAGRIWGTEIKSPKTKGQVDIFEKLIILRCEVSAITKVLIDAGLTDGEKLMAQIGEEAEALELSYAAQFPGIRATDDGMEFYDVQKARETMRGWPK